MKEGYTPLWLQVQNWPLDLLRGPNRKVFEFIREGVSEESANSVGMSWENSTPFPAHWTMAHIAKETGLFQSVSQARKNGWNRDIEVGYSEQGGLGKQKILCFFIWNPL
jgi:hypothetical protein